MEQPRPETTHGDLTTSGPSRQTPHCEGTPIHTSDGSVGHESPFQNNQPTSPLPPEKPLLSQVRYLPDEIRSLETEVKTVAAKPGPWSNGAAWLPWRHACRGLRLLGAGRKQCAREARSTVPSPLSSGHWLFRGFPQPTAAQVGASRFMALFLGHELSVIPRPLSSILIPFPSTQCFPLSCQIWMAFQDQLIYFYFFL